MRPPWVISNLFTGSALYVNSTRMKTIGLIGGTSWVSTIDYYKLMNQLTNEKLGSSNAARIILVTIQ